MEKWKNCQWWRTNQSFMGLFMNFLHGVFNPFAVPSSVFITRVNKHKAKYENYCHVLRGNL